MSEQMNTELKKQNKGQKQLKVWQGIVGLLAAAILLFVVVPPFFISLGLYGSLIGEILFLAVAVGAVILFKADLKEVFPFKTPFLGGTVGTVLIWIGTFLLEMVLILIMTVLFPEKILEVNTGLAKGMLSDSLFLSIVVIAVSPAICEEALFRGMFMSSLKTRLGKWPVLLISGCIFGIFHGDISRFIPTAISGVMMGYILWESGNIFYSMLFHFINNALQVFLLYAMKDVYFLVEGQSAVMTNQAEMLMSVGVYLLLSAAAPGAIYIGNYLLHGRTPGYRTKLFPSRKPGVVIGVIGVSAVLFLSGIIMMGVSIGNGANLTAFF